jgi:hypothetical protein
MRGKVFSTADIHVRKGWGAFHAGAALAAADPQATVSAEVAQWRNNTYNECTAMLAEETDTPPEEVCSLISNYLRKSGIKARTTSFDLLWPELNAKYPKSAGIWLIRGRYYIKFAWQARGNGFADSVSADAWKLFAERLDLAQEALENSWKLRPMEETAIEFLKLELGQGKGRQRMEKFFQWAMLLNTNSYDACIQKLNYLYPRWYGSPEEMLQFGWECVDSKTWGGNVPLRTEHIDLIEKPMVRSSGRHNAGNFVKFSTASQRASDHVFGSAKSIPPQPMTDQHDMIFAGGGLFWAETAAQFRAHSQYWEQIRRDSNPCRWTFVIIKRRVRTFVGRKAAETGGAALQVEKICW